MSYDELLSRHEFVSLQDRREMQSAKFMCKLIGGKVDCPDILSKISIHVPRTSRTTQTFWIPKAKTNVALKGPVMHLSRCADKLITDPFSCS